MRINNNTNKNVICNIATKTNITEATISVKSYKYIYIFHCIYPCTNTEHKLYLTLFFVLVFNLCNIIVVVFCCYFSY